MFLSKKSKLFALKEHFPSQKSFFYKEILLNLSKNWASYKTKYLFSDHQPIWIMKEKLNHLNCVLASGNLSPISSTVSMAVLTASPMQFLARQE